MHRLYRRSARASYAVGAAAALIILSVSFALALDPAAERGHLLVRRDCAGCHAVETTGASPLPEAPPFRTLHLRYPLEDLAESFAEGVRTGHPEMPEWKLDPIQIDDLIAYLKTL